MTRVYYITFFFVFHSYITGLWETLTPWSSLLSFGDVAPSLFDASALLTAHCSRRSPTAESVSRLGKLTQKCPYALCLTWASQRPGQNTSTTPLPGWEESMLPVRSTRPLLYSSSWGWIPPVCSRCCRSVLNFTLQRNRSFSSGLAICVNSALSKVKGFFFCFFFYPFVFCFCFLYNTANKWTFLCCHNHTKYSSIHFTPHYILCSGSLQRVVVFYPQILMVPVKTVKNVVLFLRERCLFTTQQVTDILRETPAIVVENTAQLEYKFQVCVWL